MKSVAKCLMEFIGDLESKSFDFSELKKELSKDETGEEIFQFDVLDPSACFAKVTFIRSFSGDRLDNLYFQLAPGFETTIAELGKDFGEFRIPPAEPSGTWTALVKYSTSNELVKYAIIAEANEEITPQTPIRNLSIRLDYQD